MPLPDLLTHSLREWGQHRFRAQSGYSIATIVALALQPKIQGDQERAKHALLSAFDTNLIEDNADRAHTPRMTLG